MGTQKTGFDFNPNLANTIAEANAAHGATGSQGVQDLLANPTANTGFQATLAGLLQSLKGSEAEGRQALADQFKAAGAEQSGAMGTSFANLEDKYNQSHIAAAGEALRSFLPSAVAGYGEQAKLGGPSLLEALKTGQSLDLANTNPMQPEGAAMSDINLQRAGTLQTPQGTLGIGPLRPGAGSGAGNVNPALKKGGTLF